MLRVYDRLIREFKEEQQKIKKNYLELSVVELRDEYLRLRDSYQVYDYNINSEVFQGYSLLELGGIWLFLMQMHYELNKFNKVDWKDKNTCVNIVSASYSYKSILDRLTEE